MQGQVQVLVSFEPDRVFFRNVAKGSTESEVVVLAGEKADKVKLSDPVSSRPEVKAELTTKDGKQAVKISFTAPDKEGRHSAQVTVKTGLEKPAELRLHVMAQVTGDLVPDRNYAIFAPFKADKPSTFSLNVKSLTGKPFKILKVVDPAGSVKGVAKKADGGWKVDLTLTKAPGTPRGKIQIHTDRADQRQLLVNYSVRGGSRHMPPNLRKIGTHGAPGQKPTLVPTGKGSKGTPLRLKLNPSTRRIQRPIKKVPPPAKP